MSILGTLVILASLGTSFGTADNAQGLRLDGGSSFSDEPPPLVQRLNLLGGAQIEREEVVFLPTPVGRVEVTLLRSEAQLQLGTLEEPLEEAVLAFAPAGSFCRKERPSGRVVVSLPVAYF